jgi:serine/threonine protein kinase
MAELPADLAAAATALGLQIAKIVRRTDKTLLADGTLAGQRVAVKCLLSSDPLWSARLRHEVRVYQVFADSPPPVRVPRLFYTDNSRLLILEWLDGHTLDEDRYPQRALTTTETEAALGCVLEFSRWSAPPGAFGAIFDYPDWFGRHLANGHLTDTDMTALGRLLSRVGPPSQISHGDPLPSNILLGADSETALLDWEFAGLFLPGFDLAMFHTQLGARTPSVKTRIDEMVADADAEISFVLNLAAVLTRELRIHQELPGGPLRDSRLLLIEEAWQQARERLHQLATGRP